MILFTKSILLDPVASDGLRISVMSRHTQNDGKTPDPRIRPYDIHIPVLGPSPKLIGAYYRNELSWEEFKCRYLTEIRTPEKASLVNMLANLAMVRTVTLLCVEDEPIHCHRKLLAEECQKVQPGLIIEHR